MADAEAHLEPLDQPALARLLAEARAWQRSGGQEGRPLDLASYLMEGLDLAGLSAPDLRLDGSRLIACDLSEAALPDLIAAGTRFEGCTMIGLRAPKASLIRARLVACDLSRADLTRATLADTVLERCRLTGARFTASRWLRARMIDSTTDGAIDLDPPARGA